VDRLAANGTDSNLGAMQLRRAPEDKMLAAIPRILDAQGKFPERGDVDIVGPMIRDAVMARGQADEKKPTTPIWLKSFVEKVGLRR
jgi:hypothetical protein